MSWLGRVFCHVVRGDPGTRRRGTSFKHFIYKHGDRGRHEHKGMTLILDKDTGNTEDL